MKKTVRMWWNLMLFTLTNSKVKEVEVGGFRFVFRKYSMLVRSLSDNWRMRVLCGEHAYGYLLESMRQNRLDNLHGYAVIMYSLAVSLTKDQKLVSDVTRDVKAYAARVDRQAEKEAKRTEKESDSEILLVERMAEENAKKLNKKNKK
jgi:hypothetical protein